MSELWSPLWYHSMMRGARQGGGQVGVVDVVTGRDNKRHCFGFRLNLLYHLSLSPEKKACLNKKKKAGYCRISIKHKGFNFNSNKVGRNL